MKCWNVKAFEDFEGGLGNHLLAASIEKLRNNDQRTEILMDELRANLDNGLRAPEATPMVTSWKSGTFHLYLFNGSSSSLN